MAASLDEAKKQLKAEMEEMVLASSTVEKEDILNGLCKSQECNVKVTGVHYRYKDWQKKNAKGRNEWRADMIRRIFVNSNIVEEEILFESRPNGKKFLRDVVRDMHPLGQKDKSATKGPAIIIAFTQSMLANDIKEKVRKDAAGIELTKPKRGREAEEIKIISHLPPILEALRNECLRERRRLIAESEGARRYICDESHKWPWITLLAVGDDKKTPIPFKIEDSRLGNPARTLAVDHLNGIRKFVPYFILNAAQKAKLGPPIMTTVVNPVRRHDATDAVDMEEK